MNIKFVCLGLLMFSCGVWATEKSRTVITGANSCSCEPNEMGECFMPRGQGIPTFENADKFVKEFCNPHSSSIKRKTFVFTPEGKLSVLILEYSTRSK